MAITLKVVNNFGDSKLESNRWRFVKTAGLDFLFPPNERRVCLAWSFQNVNQGGMLRFGYEGNVAIEFALANVTATRATDHKLLTIEDIPVLPDLDLYMDTSFITGITFVELLCPCGQHPYLPNG